MGNFIKIAIKLFTIITLLSIFFGPNAFSQERLSLTITPPLIKININPGDSITSSVKVVNSNPNDLTLYAIVRDFIGTTETGMIEFISEKEAASRPQYFLSRWIEISKSPIIIPAYQSAQIPFSIKVPKDAEPGGKYAAILIGTNPAEEKVSGGGIKISSLVSALLLVNVRGEVIESARVREFSTEKGLYDKAEVKFTLRIENLGNVHIQPQGEIRIFNLWGKERGLIPINHQTEFGNVLPNSIRKWDFIWKGEDSFFEAGRYKAALTLLYGNETKQTIHQVLYFWIIPVVPTASILGGITLFFLTTFLMVRAYVRRAIYLAQKEAGIIAGSRIGFQAKILKKPIAQEIIDLKEKTKVVNKKSELVVFIIKRWIKPALAILIILLGTVAIYLYFKDVLKATRTYEIIIEKGTNMEP